MTSLISQARKGNSDAMRLLYNENKDSVLFLCTLLLENRGTACNATSRIFRSMWDLVISGEIESEEVFAKAVIEKAVNHSKTIIMKNDQKAFRIPANKNFTSIEYPEESKTNDDTLALFILHCLPPLQRFIYVLSAFFGYDDRALADLFKTNDDTIRLALDAEETNILRFSTQHEKATGEVCSMSLDEFHRELKSIEATLTVPTGVNATVLLCIDAVCDPIFEQERKHRRKTLLITASLIWCVFLVVLCVFVIINHNNSTNADNSLDDLSYEEEIDILSDVETTDSVDPET